MATNKESEKKYYNAVNIALNGDYHKIKSIKIPTRATGRESSDFIEDPRPALRGGTKTWEEAWQKIQKDFPKINPDEEYEKINKTGASLFLSDDCDFPENLKEIPWPPFAIYIKGNLKSIKSIAIVGTRKAGPQGKSAAKQIAKELAQNGLQIISGLAMGIDESSHQGALEAEGATAAVLPSGINNVYPRQNQSLSEKILENNGALISEFPVNFRPFLSSFIQRNRIISGLSLATVIIEAPEKSGALATARFALEQNRDIFVAPGPVANPNYKGSHKLLRDGAGLITCAEDILNDLGIENMSQKKDKIFEKITDEEKIVLETINQLGWPVSVDKIAESSKIQIQKVNQIIAFLTIKGILK